MTVSLKHTFVSNVADSGDASLVQPSNWNAEHTLTAAADTLLGAVTAGAVTEITCTSAGRALLDDADAAAQRTTLSAAGTGVTNTFTANQIISVTDNTNAALRVTQLGTGDAILVEDSTNPDSSPFVVKADGAVGVKTTAPTEALTVNGNAEITSAGFIKMTGRASDGWLLQSISSGAASEGGLWRTNGSVALSSDNVEASFIADKDNLLRFETNYAERMRITSAVSENILFGTTASQGAGRVQSLGDSATSAFLAYASSTAQRETFRFVNGNGLIGSLGMTGTSLNITTGGSVRLTVGSSGDVGIGTASPACSLDVTGGIQTSRTAVTSPAATDGNIFSGTYTPTLTNTTNVAASTAYQFQYMRVGNVVTLSGAIDVDATAASTLTVVGVSLPIASNFSASQNAGGAGGADGVNSVPCIVYGDAANDRLTLTFTPIDGVNRTYRFIATYRVI